MKITGSTFYSPHKPKELQKFVLKYVNSEVAFDDGLDEVLIRFKAND